MSAFLNRDAAPLAPQEWERLDQAVVAAAKQHLVGRRFIPVFGPFGIGTQTIHQDVFSGTEATCIDMTGDCSEEPLGAGKRIYRQLPILHKDFLIHWRDVETAHQSGVPLDCSLAAAAAFFVAQAEDKLIFHGNRDLGMEGLLNASSRNSVPKRDWNEPGALFADVTAAAERLGSQNFYGPYTLIVSPKVFALGNRVYADTGVLEADQIERIADGGVYRCSIIPDGTALLVSTGAHNIDLAVSQDLATAYMDTDKMNHIFRVLEVIALRIKRAGAICTIE